jgi:hypothetical protein
MLKASFLLLLTFLLFINFNTVCVDAQTTTDDSDDTNVDTDTVSDDGTDTNDDSDSMGVTGDSDDDSDDDDDDSDSISATGDSDDSDDDDSTDDSTSGDSDDDDSTSGDSDDDDSTSGTSDDDSTSGDSDSSDNGSNTVTTANPTTYCAQLATNDCSNAYANDGTAICAVNAVSQNCYAVVASSGIYGSGNYDDGFTAAQQSAEQESQKLNTIVGVLAGIITVMALGIIGGAYYLHTKSKRMVQEQELETVQSTTAIDTADAEPML